MSQPIGRPASGARYVLERAESSDASVVYRGLVRLPDADMAIEVTVALPGGATRAVVAGEAPDHEKTAAALIRAATKSAVAAGEELPRKLERWRG